MITISGGIIETTKGYVYWDLVTENEIDCIEIHNLYVDPKYRGQGFARTLLTCAIAMIKKQYPELKIEISADPKEPEIDIKQLVKFYESLGLFVYYQAIKK
jgi:GNAT superfamily N-acetyltransferase